MSDEIQPAQSRYRSMSDLLDDHGDAAVTGTAASSENVLDLTAGAPSWTVSEYCACFE